MKYTKIEFIETDYIRVRDFLVKTYQEGYLHKNWLIDRWNFTRYVSQIFHDTFDKWISTNGLWVDEFNNIVALANTEGENRGEVFFQFGNIDISDELINEMIDHAEDTLYSVKDDYKFIELRVSDNRILKKILKDRGYSLCEDWKETTLVFDVEKKNIELPNGYKIVNSKEFSAYDVGFAHGKAFGYYKGDKPDDDDAERAFDSLRKAPDFKPELHLAVIDENGEVASFLCTWYDEINKISILEPVGTIPTERKKGLSKALIYHAINLVSNMGCKKMYVGSDQQFYYSIGFKFDHSMEIWQKKWERGELNEIL